MKKFLLTLIITITINVLFSLDLKAYSMQEPQTDNYIIFIDVNELTLSLLKEDSKELIKKYPVAMGKPSTPSPIGQWRITSKALKDGPFGGYWLGLNAPWDTFGIHGTSNPSSIGSLASNGCIRMYNYNIKELFNLVNYDTRVIVYSGPNWRFSPYNRKININDKGTDVFYVQRALKNIGYYEPVPDGIYGYALEQSILQYKIDANLEGDSTIDEKLLDSLGLYKFE